jgi:hypothetical protein
MLTKRLFSMAAAIAGVLAVTSVGAYAAPATNHHVSGSHWYIGIGAGDGQGHSTASATVAGYGYAATATASSASSGFAFRLLGGWRYANERGDTIGIGVTDTGVSMDGSSAAGIVGLDLNAKLHLTRSWFVSGRVGGYSGRIFETNRNGYTYGESHQGPYYGVGTGIDINIHNAISVSWDRYQVADYTDRSFGTPVQVSDTYLDVYLLSYTYTF